MADTMNSDFYLFLPSNSSKEFFKNNTLSHFSTQINRPLTLTGGQWEVGLAEVIHNSWGSTPVIDSNDATGVYDGKGGVGGNVSLNSIKIYADRTGENEIIYFPKHTYSSLEELLYYIMTNVKNYYLGQRAIQVILAELNAMNTNLSTNPYKEYSTSDNVNIIKHYSYNVKFAVKDYESMGELLDEIDSHSINRIVRSELIGKAKVFLSKHINYFHDRIITPQPPQHSNLAFIYCDVVSHSLVGDSLARVLRVIKMKKTSDHVVFNPISYFRVDQTFIQSISIEFRYDNGDFIDFHPGYNANVVVLHFRRRASNFF